MAALGSLRERVVKGPGGLPQHSLHPAFSPLPQASAGASQERAASSGAARAAALSAARQRPTVGMRGTGISGGQVALERE